MKVLIVGGGGREHAIAWKLAADDPTVELVSAPGNPGLAELGRCLAVSTTDGTAIAELAQKERVDLVIIGPEAPLAAGVADTCRAAGLRVFGPGRTAAQLESSKRFAKEMMLRVGIPTAHATWHVTAESAISAAREHTLPLVVKASGLAAGKGVIVAATHEAAAAAIHSMMIAGAFGEAGSEVLIEDFLEGEELSVFAITDGESFVVLPAAQDHKRLLESDLGPNTGGMGAYAPASIASTAVLRRVSAEIIAPTLAAMRDVGAPFSGLLYAGLMLTGAGPMVIEFNCRFGDPETQAILPSLDAPLLPLLLAASRLGGLKGYSTTVATRQYAVTTVVAAAFYPDRPRVGDAVVLPSLEQGQIVFQAGTAASDRGLVTAGGRVLAITGLGATVQEAKAKSLAGAERVRFEGKQFRRDIAWRELARGAGAT